MLSKRGAALLLSAVLLLAYFGAHADARELAKGPNKYRVKIASLKKNRMSYLTAHSHKDSEPAAEEEQEAALDAKVMSLVEPASVSHEDGAEEELKAASEHKEGQQQPAAKGAAKADKDAKAAAGASKDAPAKDAPAAKDDKKAPADASKPIAAGAAKPTAAAAAAADKPADKPTSAPKDAPAAAKPDQQKQAEAPKADEPAAAAKVTPEVPKQDATKAAAPADKVAAAPAQKPAEQKPAEHKPGEHKPAEQKQGAPLKAADPKAPSQPAAKQPEAPLRNPADVSIFDVKKSNTPDGKVEVVLKPLVAPPVPRGAQPPAKSGDAPGKAATKSASDADANGPVVPPTSCKKTKISLHDADIAYTTGDSGLSVTKLSASCGAAASHTPALAGGCSLKCDYEEDLDKVTLVGDGPDGTSAANADKPATCSFSTNSVLKGSCKALVKILCCVDSPAPVTFSSESYTVSSSSSSGSGSTPNEDAPLFIPSSNPGMIEGDNLVAAFNPLFRLDVFDAAEPAEEKPLSVGEMLEQAAAVLEAKRQAAQALALQKMQQLHADLVANQARMAAANARLHEQTQAQLRQNLHSLASLSQPQWVPAPLRSVSQPPHDPTSTLLHVITPQFHIVPTAVDPEDFEHDSSLEDDDSAEGWANATNNVLDAAADTASTWSNSLGELFNTSRAWWPWST